MRDRQKRIYKTILYIDPFGEMHCRVKIEDGPRQKIHVVLLEGGKVETDNDYNPDRPHTFIKDWILA